MSYLNVEELLSENWGTLINGETWTIEDSTLHLNWDRHFQDLTGELNMCAQIINVLCSLKNLHEKVNFTRNWLPGRRLSCRKFRELDPFSQFRFQASRSRFQHTYIKNKVESGVIEKALSYKEGGVIHGEFNVVKDDQGAFDV